MGGIKVRKYNPLEIATVTQFFHWRLPVTQNLAIKVASVVHEQSSSMDRQSFISGTLVPPQI
jgi:hypothetical protein